MIQNVTIDDTQVFCNTNIFSVSLKDKRTLLSGLGAKVMTWNLWRDVTFLVFGHVNKVKSRTPIKSFLHESKLDVWEI